MHPFWLIDLKAKLYSLRRDFVSFLTPWDEPLFSAQSHLFKEDLRMRGPWWATPLRKAGSLRLEHSLSLRLVPRWPFVNVATGSTISAWYSGYRGWVALATLSNRRAAAGLFDEIVATMNEVQAAREAEDERLQAMEQDPFPYDAESVGLDKPDPLAG